MINPAEFEKLVDRQIDFITTDTIFQTWRDAKLYKKLGFQGLDSNNSLFIGFKYYASKVDVNRVKQLAKQKGITRFVKKFCSEGEKHGKKALSLSNKTRKANWKNKSEKQLFKILSQFYEKARNIIAFTWPTHAIALAMDEELRKLLAGKGANAAEINEIIAILSFPTRENTPVIENRKLMKIALQVKKLNKQPQSFAHLPESLQDKLQRHVEKFGFLGARGLRTKCWTTAGLFRRVLELSSDKTLAEKIEKSQREIEENKKQTEKIMQQLKLTKIERELVKAAKELVWFRTYRTEVMYHIFSDVEPLLGEIGNRFGYKLEEVQLMTAKEILNLSRQKVPQSLVEKRRQGYAIVAEKGKLKELYDKDYLELEKLFKEKIESTEIRGIVACRGKVTGVAKIVPTSNELGKVQRGDVLITNMTTPDFIPAMQLAAAFITNEGGITCHAAIISREMNKPCVIATKMATKVFKDGDLVEVNANLGIVRKLPQR